MTKLKDIKFILKLSSILFLIVFIATLLLTVCNYFTVDKIAEIEAQTADDARRKVIANAVFKEINITEFDKSVQEEINSNNFISAHEAYVAGEFSGYCINVFEPGFGGNINMIVGVAPDMSFTGVEIISMSETPGLGAKAQEKSFIDQFSNKNGVLDVVKNKKNASADQINAISGATITSKAVVTGANKAHKIAEVLKKEAE